MGFALSSFVRMFKMLFISVCCSFFLLIAQLIFERNFASLHVISLLLFLLWIGIDSYQFSSLYTTIRDSLLGLVLPLFTCLCVVTLGYFFVPGNLFNFVFLPMRAFESLNFLGYHSLILSAICWIVVMCLMSWIGSMHPIEIDDDYFNPQREA